MAENLNYLLFLLLLLGSIAMIVQLWLKDGWLRKSGVALAALSFVLSLVLVVARIVQSGQSPFSNMYGFVLCFVVVILGFYLVLAIKYKLPLPGAFILPVAAILIGCTFFLSDEIAPLMPALRSNWLFIHVLTSIISYGGFAIAFGVSLYYLVKIPSVKDAAQTPPAEETAALAKRLEKFIYNSTVLGFVFLTMLIITGSVWAEEVWGSWWSWDPKETWALITWLIYACYFHLRHRGWAGHKACYLSIIGFACVLFTFLGVSFLLGGLHSYV